jgi:hypothetical protein
MNAVEAATIPEEQIMFVDGTWKVTVNSPMGKEETVLELRSEAGALQGTQSGAHGICPIKEGHVNGDTIAWSSSITSPIRITLQFTGVLAGDSMKGKVKLGMFGAYDFAGSRT